MRVSYPTQWWRGIHSYTISRWGVLTVQKMKINFMSQPGGDLNTPTWSSPIHFTLFNVGTNWSRRSVHIELYTQESFPLHMPSNQKSTPIPVQFAHFLSGRHSRIHTSICSVASVVIATVYFAVYDSVAILIVRSNRFVWFINRCAARNTLSRFPSLKNRFSVSEKLFETRTKTFLSTSNVYAVI